MNGGRIDCVNEPSCARQRRKQTAVDVGGDQEAITVWSKPDVLLTFASSNYTTMHVLEGVVVFGCGNEVCKRRQNLEKI